MSKGLEALKRLAKLYLVTEEDRLDFENVEKELKEYEELKKPKRIVGTTTMDKALEKFLIDNNPSVAKKLKALDVIKNKRVNIQIFSNISKNIPYYFYLKHHNNIWYGMSSDEFTEEEYDLLKEVLL